MTTEEQKEQKEKPVKYLQIPLPAAHYDAALAAYAKMTRGRINQIAQQNNRQLDQQELGQVSDEEVVQKVIRQQVLSTLERKVQQDALDKLKETY